MTNFRRWVVRVLFALLIGIPAALLVVYFINPFGVRSLDPRQRITAHGLYRVSSKSMLPGMIPGQVLITRAGAYAKEAPERRDVVTLLVEDEGTQVWIQRVMGLPGETISIEGGTVFVQGKALREPYVASENNVQEYSLHMDPVTVPAGHYFMLGDNRDNSMDSRLRGFTPREDITGRVIGSL